MFFITLIALKTCFEKKKVFWLSYLVLIDLDANLRGGLEGTLDLQSSRAAL